MDTRKDRGPDWVGRAFQNGMAGRYYENDGRLPLAKTLSMRGPMLRAALDHGFKAWRYPREDGVSGEAVSIEGVRGLIASGAYDKCMTWPKVWFVVDGVASLGVWLLWHHRARGCPWDGPRVEFLAPRYPELQKLAAEQARRRSFAKGIRDPQTPPKDMGTRSDTL